MKKPHLTIALLLASASALSVAEPLGGVGPDSTEQLFWQSAERLGTADAYKAYLSRYPSGFFMPLANAALGKAAETKGTDSRPTAALPVQGAGLNAFSSEASSGAVSFRIGESFDGPKAINVGGLGVRKKLVLPTGRWVALAAQDEAIELPAVLSHSSYRVTVTTASFGRFAGGRLVSLMTFKFSSRKTNPAVSWSSLDGCAGAGTVPLQSSRPTKGGWRDECAALAFESSPLADKSPATAELQRSLARLGAAVSGSTLVSTWSYSEKQRGYLGIARHDWPGAALGDEGQTIRDWSPENQTGERQVFASRLWSWSKDYGRFASEGYMNDFEDNGKGPTDFAFVASK
jgi:hypothetical protein